MPYPFSPRFIAYSGTKLYTDRVASDDTLSAPLSEPHRGSSLLRDERAAPRFPVGGAVAYTRRTGSRPVARLNTKGHEEVVRPRRRATRSHPSPHRSTSMATISLRFRRHHLREQRRPVENDRADRVTRPDIAPEWRRSSVPSEGTTWTLTPDWPKNVPPIPSCRRAGNQDHARPAASARRR